MSAVLRVLISGGSRGIGAACVRAFCAKGAACAFFYHAHEAEARAVSAETAALPIRCDLRDREEVSRGFAAAMDVLGGIDVLVNCAGISQIGLFTDQTDAEWQTLMAVNLDAAAKLSRLACVHMVAQKSGVILQIGSVWGRVGASCEVAYSASKAALRGLTMALAKELGPSGIRVNCIEPGVIDTEMNAALGAEARADLAEQTPLCRLGETSEVASAVLFLASDAASFITGQILGVDGGFAL